MKIKRELMVELPMVKVRNIMIILVNGDDRVLPAESGLADIRLSWQSSLSH